MSPKNTNNNKKKYTLCASHAVNLFCLQFSLKKTKTKNSHKDRFSSFWFSATTVGTKWLSVMKSPATMLTVPSLEPGLCSSTQLISVGLVDITRSFRDSVGCVQMYFRSTVRLIPVTKNPSANNINTNRRLTFLSLQTDAFSAFTAVVVTVCVQYSGVPGLSCFFRCSKASISASALHLLAHQ